MLFPFLSERYRDNWFGRRVQKIYLPPFYCEQNGFSLSSFSFFTIIIFSVSAFAIVKVTAFKLILLSRGQDPVATFTPRAKKGFALKYYSSFEFIVLERKKSIVDLLRAKNHY